MVQQLWKKYRDPQNIKNRNTTCSAISFLSICSVELKSESRRDIFTPLFLEVLLTVAKIWK